MARRSITAAGWEPDRDHVCGYQKVLESPTEQTLPGRLDEIRHY
jgi:hypothetical protein